MTVRQLSHYLVENKIGQGGMGIVYRGTDTRLKRTVALKFLTKALPADAAERKRFLREARAASSASHPNVCVIHAIEEVEGEEFIVMEFVEGVTLRTWAAQKRSELRSTAVPLRDLLGVALQIARGLDAAHRQGIVHRDVKPENVMVTKDDFVKIMDFGLAKLANESKLTRTGATMGTVAYMSPEQVQGGEINAQSDIYSFGVLLFELLSGALPFEADHAMAMMYAIVNTEPRPLKDFRPGIEPELARIVMKCMEKAKSSRYQTMGEVIRELSSIEELRRTIPAPGGRTPGKLHDQAVRRRFQAIVRNRLGYVGIGVVVLVVVILIFALRNGSATGASLSVTSVPSGSRVWINGEEAGLTPLEGHRVPAGRTIVHVALKSYAPADSTVTLEDNQSAVLHFPLRQIGMRTGDTTAPAVALKADTTSTGGPASAAAKLPVQQLSVDSLATLLVTHLQNTAGSLRGHVAVRPFTFQNTQMGSDFSRFFKALLVTRIEREGSWKLIPVDYAEGAPQQQSAPQPEYELAGEYWEQASHLRFFARLEARATGQIKARADAIVEAVEMRKLGLPWKPANIKRILDEAHSLGNAEPQTGDLKLDLLTNKGTENLIFTEGDTLRTYVKVNRPCTVRIFYYTADGAHYVLTGPNDLKLSGDQVDRFIPIDSATCTGPFGAEIIQAFATTDKFESIKTKPGPSLYYELEDDIKSAMTSTRGIRKLGGGGAIVEKRAVITTVPK